MVDVSVGVVDYLAEAVADQKADVEKGQVDYVEGLFLVVAEGLEFAVLELELAFYFY